MADRTTKQGASILGVGAAACAACCAPPVIAFLAAASFGTLVGIALFGTVGLAVAVVAVVAYLRRQRARHHDDASPPSVPVSLGRKPDA